MEMQHGAGAARVAEIPAWPSRSRWLVVLGRLALNPWWGVQQNRHLVFLPTVLLAAWLGGFGPGVVSAVC